MSGRKKNSGIAHKEAHFKPRDLLVGGTLCGLVLFVAINLQQFGLLYTTPGKAGFLTAMYILIVSFVLKSLILNNCS